MIPSEAGSGVTAVLVTHNSPAILVRVVGSLLSQTVPPDRIVIVDSGSANPDPVCDLAARDSTIEVICTTNVGFAAGNNLGMRRYADSAFFILVNPDVMLGENWIAGAMDYLQKPEGASAGIISSPLRGMDLNTGAPTGLWDSLGIYRNRNGRWYDAGMREAIEKKQPPTHPYEPPAICGALMFFSGNLYRSIFCEYGFFDERFHTYKEDIDLSLRTRKAGHRLVMLPNLMAWHCRGWSAGRHLTPYRMRRLSARNDIIIAMRYFRFSLPVCIAKYIYVTTIERLWYAAELRFLKRCRDCNVK